MKKYGTPLTTFAKIRAKASRHAANNPLALFRKEVTADDVMNDQVIWPGVMTRLMACPPTCGGAAAVLVSEKFASTARPAQGRADRGAGDDHRHALDLRAGDMMQVVGFDMAQAAANKVYEAAGIGPEDLDVVELHDCFAHNELITYEALGLCPEGGAERFIDDGDNTYGGKSRDQSVRRPAVQGPSARRHRPRAMLRADAAAARHRRRDARSTARGWRCSTISASAAPASSRCTNAPEA